MADIIDFAKYQIPENDLDTMTREELLDFLEQLRAQLAALDAVEPEDMESEAYEAWGGQHEMLEDQADEVMDLLDEMK